MKRLQCNIGGQEMDTRTLLWLQRAGYTVYNLLDIRMKYSIALSWYRYQPKQFLVSFETEQDFEELKGLLEFIQSHRSCVHDFTNGLP